MKVRDVAVVVAAALFVAVVLALGVAGLVERHQAPQMGLHSVWCVRPGYPVDLAAPVVVGPGTGLSGCPSWMRQVTP